MEPSCRLAEEDSRFIAAEALKHLALIDLNELCNEAKVERCRATQGLRSCGRYVHHVLSSCGHASLCEECCQRCDRCPICRVSVPKSNDRLRLRLYYECKEAGLISKKHDGGFQEEEDKEGHVVDVQRLYSLFNVALENNLVSLICHYVTDVCMDEAAVSSDPVTAILLDEVVVKDWCKQAFKIMVAELTEIYDCTVEQMKSSLSLLLKFSVQLGGISDVLEVLESSCKGNLSAQSHDMHHLQENVLKTKQHLEIMIWCVRHQFLEDINPRYTEISSWRSSVRVRKAAATTRAWPVRVHRAEKSSGQEGSLFIEDALSNLEIEHASIQEGGVESVLAALQKDANSSFLRTKIEGVSGHYPFETLRAATDILFLHGHSDLVVAKQAIFLYYLFDRHWTLPNENWRHIVHDFAATFGINQHSLLESFTFYLLDDETDAALQEACRILPEISVPETHPKVAQVLLERFNPDAALMVLRWSGHDGAQLVSLGEAVTAVRIRVECALLTEAFMYQRSICLKFKERKLKHGPSIEASDDFRDEKTTWTDWLETLVTEICCLCILRNLVDRMIDLPWNGDEETYIRKCLLEYAAEDPSTIVGSLLVVFYLQRYRYPEAYQVDRKLQNMEQDYISENSPSNEVLLRMRSTSQWRAKLVEKSLESLPEVQQRQVRTGNFPEAGVACVNGAEQPSASDTLNLQQPKSTSLLVPFSADRSIVTGMDPRAPSWNPSASETPVKLAGSVKSFQFETYKHGSTSIFNEKLISERRLKPETTYRKKYEYHDSPLSHVRKGASKVLDQNSNYYSSQSNQYLGEPQNDFVCTFEDTGPCSQNALFNPATNRYYGLGSISAREYEPNTASKRSSPDERDNMISSDAMDVSSRYGEQNGSAAEDMLIGGPRWRSDEFSDDEEDQSPEKAHFHATPSRRIRKSRFSRR